MAVLRVDGYRPVSIACARRISPGLSYVGLRLGAAAFHRGVGGGGGHSDCRRPGASGHGAGARRVRIAYLLPLEANQPCPSLIFTIITIPRATWTRCAPDRARWKSPWMPTATHASTIRATTISPYRGTATSTIGSGC